MRFRHVVARERSLGDRPVPAGNLASRGTLAGLPLALVACSAAIALVAGACTGAGESSHRRAAATTVTTATAPRAATTERPAVAAAVNVALVDYTIRAARNPVRADRLTLRVVNHDRVPHNLTLIATKRPPGRLPTSGIRVDVSDPALSVVAATPMLRPLGTGSLTAGVHPGRYVLVCTVPHHYVRSRMVATLTVK